MGDAAVTVIGDAANGDRLIGGVGLTSGACANVVPCEYVHVHNISAENIQYLPMICIVQDLLPSAVYESKEIRVIMIKLSLCSDLKFKLKIHLIHVNHYN